MPEFWESVYSTNQTMWGENPTDNAIEVLKIFQNRKVKSVLIPGFGYGRNAKVFHDEGMEVTGIEISKSAIDRAKKHFGENTTIHHGSVTDMPYDNKSYDAIYCYSLIHLLPHPERLQCIERCYNQLKRGGIMVFVGLSINDHRLGEGVEVEKNTYQSPNGLNLYFYDEASVKEEFGAYNITDLCEINEPTDQPNEKHWMVVCEKIAS